jgi:hypothetical protein
MSAGPSDKGGTGGAHGPTVAGRGAPAEAGEGGILGAAGASESGGEAGVDGGGGGTDGGDTGGGGTGDRGGAAAVGGASGNSGLGGAATGGVAGVSGAVGGPPTGSLVSADDRCVRAPSPFADSARVGLDVCDGSPSERWQRDAAGRLFVVGVGSAGATALQIDGDSMGAPLAVAEPRDTLSQQWLFEDVHLVNRSGLCIDMPWGDFSDHMRAQLARCHWDPPQAWTLSPTGTISHQDAGEGPPGHCLDVYGGFVGDGVSVQTYGCHGGDGQEFSFQDGSLQYKGECFGAFADDPSREHSPLETQSCRASDDPERNKQQFYVEGPIRALGACLDWDDASSELRLKPCDGSERQRWRWYF